MPEPHRRPDVGEPWAWMRQIDGQWSVIDRGTWSEPNTPMLVHTKVGDRLVVGERAYEVTGYDEHWPGSLMPKVAILEPVG